MYLFTTPQLGDHRYPKVFPPFCCSFVRLPSSVHQKNLVDIFQVENCVGMIVRLSVLLMMCIVAQAQCPNEKLLSSSTGSFDFPSRTPEGFYPSDETCRWRIRCPSGMTVGIRTHIRTPRHRSTDFFEFFDADGSTTLKKAYGENTHFNYLFHTNEIVVVFVADDDGVVAKGLDGPGVYECHSNLCHTNKILHTQEVITAPTDSKTLVFAGTQYDNEHCSWKIKCNPTEFVNIRDYVSTNQWMDINITDNLGNIVTNIPRYSYTPAVSEYNIDFVSSPALRQLFIWFGCKTSMATATDGCQGETANLTAVSGNIRLPSGNVFGYAQHSDGNAGSHFALFNDMNCEYNIQCSTGMFPHVSGWAHLYDDDSLSALDGSGVRVLEKSWEQYDKHYDYQTKARYVNYMAHEPSLTLKVRTGMDSYARTHNRLTTYADLQYECLPSTCQSNGSDIIIGNLDERIERKVSKRGELCTYTMKCANETNWIMFARIDGSFVGLLDENNDTISSSKWSAPLRTNQIVVTTSPRAGYTKWSDWNYRLPHWRASCMENLEGICEPGQLYDEPIQSMDHVIRIPENPAGVYFSAMQCFYDMRCPAGWTMRVSARFRTASDDDALLFLRRSDNTTLLQMSGYTEICRYAPTKKLSTCPNFWDREKLFKEYDVMLNEDNILLFWNTSASQEDDGIDYRNGPLTFNCYQSTCTSNTSVSRFEWNSTQTEATTVLTYAGNEQCKYELKCTNTSLQLYFISVWAFEGGLLKFFTPDGTRVAAARSEQASIYSELHVEYDGSLHGRLNITFECYDRAAIISCGEHLPPTVLNDFEGKFTVPIYRGLYVTDLRCTFEISCPNNMIVATGGKFHFPLDTDRMDVFDRDDTHLGMINSNRSDIESASATRNMNFVWRRNWIKLVFISDLSLGGKGLIDFGWSCLVSNCSHNSTTPLIYSHTRGATDLTIMPQALNEDCHIIIQCTNVDDWLAFESVSESVNLVDFADKDGAYVPYPNSSSMLAAMPLHMRWDPPTLRSTFSFTTSCFYNADFLDSACAPLTTLVVNEPSQQLEIPMTPFGNYYNALKCNWKVECLPGQNVAFKGELRTPINDTFDFVRMKDRNNAPMFTGRSQFWKNNHDIWVQRPFPWAYVRLDNVILIQFESDNLLAAPGFISPMQVDCIVGRCWTNSTEPIEVVHREGMPSIEVSNTYYFESCKYRLKCENPKHWVLFSKLDSGTKQYLRLFDIDDDGMSIDKVTANKAIKMNTIFFQYDSPVDRTHRFVLKFGCLKPFGNFIACADNSIDEKRPTVSDPSGTIEVPMQPNNKYTGSQFCTWKIVCPRAKAGIHMTGAIMTYNISDRFVVYDSNMVELRTMYSQQFNTSFEWDFFVPENVAFVVWMSDERRGTVGLLQDFTYTCFRSTCFHPLAHNPIGHNGVVPPKNISLGNSDGDRCRIDIRCGRSLMCLVITGASENTTGVGFENTDGIQVQWPRINPDEVLPVSRVTVIYNQPDPDHSFWFEFKCVKETRPKMCTTFGNKMNNRLWYSRTEEATASESITVSDSQSPRPTVTVTDVLTESLTATGGTASWTHELTLTYQIPPTATVTATKSPTPPPTPSRTYSPTGSTSFSPTTTHTAVPSASVSISATSSLVTTMSESITITKSQSTSSSFTSEFTQSASESTSDSIPVDISFKISPNTLYLTAIRAETTKSTLNLVVDVIGSTIVSANDSDRIFATTSIEVVSIDAEPLTPDFGFAKRRGNVWVREGVGHSETQMFFNLSTDVNLNFFEDEYIILRFFPEVFRYHEQNVTVKPVVFRIIADRTPREPGTLESSAAIAATVSGMASANAAAATQAARIGLLLDIANCRFNDDEPLSWMEYPIGAPLGPHESRYRFFAGQAVLNPALLLGIIAVHKLVAYVGGSVKGLTMIAANTWAFFPSYSIVPVLFFMQDSLTSVWLLLARHDSLTVKVAVASVLLLVWVPICGHISKTVGKRPHKLPAQFELHKRWSRLKQFLLGRGIWGDREIADADFGFSSRYSQFFACYRPGRTWFMIAEIGFSLVLSGVASIRPADGDCHNMMLAMMILNVLFAIMVTVCVPYVALFEQIIQFFIVTLEAVAAAFFYVAQGFTPDTTAHARYMSLGTGCIIGVSVLLLVKAVLDLLMLIQEQYDRLGDATFDTNLKRQGLRERIKNRVRSSNKSQSSARSPSVSGVHNVLLESVADSDTSTLAMPLLVIEDPCPSPTDLEHPEPEESLQEQLARVPQTLQRHVIRELERSGSRRGENPFGDDEDDDYYGSGGEGSSSDDVDSDTEVAPSTVQRGYHNPIAAAVSGSPDPTDPSLGSASIPFDAAEADDAL